MLDNGALTACVDVLQPARPHEDRLVLWFDIDNCLYSKAAREVDERIVNYVKDLGMNDEEARLLHRQYDREYGLVNRGLVRHHQIDSLDFDSKVDGDLPLERLLQPDPSLRSLIQSIDPSRVKICALTNAYRLHANRVLNILGIRDLFELIISCDYGNERFHCKPEREYFEEAMHHSGVSDPQRHYYVDDSALHVAAALKLGWSHSVLLDEDGTHDNEAIPKSSTVRRLDGPSIEFSVADERRPAFDLGFTDIPDLIMYLHAIHRRESVQHAT